MRCVLDGLSGSGTAVELVRKRASVFLRKASNVTAVRNEAEYLRLLMHREPAATPTSDLQPCALFVEHEQDTGDACRRALPFTAVRALTVPTGCDALRHVTDFVPNLIILDYGLPEIQARELSRQWRDNALTAHTPILVLTSSTQDDEGSDCADAVLANPCLVTTLLAASRLLLRGVSPAPSRPPAAPSA